MRMQNLLKLNNKIKKSQGLFVGSLFVFSGFLFLSWDYLVKVKDEIYSDMRIAMMDDYGDKGQSMSNEELVTNLPVAEDVKSSDNKTNYVVDYSKYLGVLEIPKIRLKRGFYNTDSKYNNIQYNVTMVSGSTTPDIANGNLILMAHSGDAYISYFAYLYKLEISDSAFVTYLGNRYEYKIVNIYEVEKNGTVAIYRNYDKTTLTLITCTKGNDYTQTVYILEMVE